MSFFSDWFFLTVCVCVCVCVCYVEVLRGALGFPVLLSFFVLYSISVNKIPHGSIVVILNPSLVCNAFCF